MLVSQAAPLFIENAQKQTPCDCAEKNGHGDIALYLESKMVFSVSYEHIFHGIHSKFKSSDFVK